MDELSPQSDALAPPPSLPRLLHLAERLGNAWNHLTDGAAVAVRLAATVARPLRQIVTDEPGADGVPHEPAGSDRAGLERELAELAVALVRWSATDQRGALLEACSGASLLVYEVFAGRDDSPTGELEAAAAAIPAELQGQIRVRTDGPYLLVGGPAGMTTWLGEPVSRPPIAALCRCGESKNKPWCDGAHAENGFSGVKLDDRVPDHVDAYPARQFEIRDNRGICAHSGFCTDAVPGVFRAGKEPFVAPAGGRADDIARAVQVCPSGALRLARDADSPADLADVVRDPNVEISKDGPYRVTGGIGLLGDAGEPIPRNAGSSREHYSLCRCGHSANKPFCSGAHWYADFRDPVPDPDEVPTLFAWAGGYPALLRMTRLFYERHVANDDLIGPLFARMEPDHPERVASWLSEVFGGPKLYSSRYGGYARMLSQHLNKHLTEEQRSRWVSLLLQSAKEAGLPGDAEFRAAFVAYLEWGSHLAVENSHEGAQPPGHMPMPRWWWVCDATPGSRPAVMPSEAIPEPEPPAAPAEGETVSFARHVKGLFRHHDRASMRFAFDLWSDTDVAEHADAIVARLRQGSMPCDGAWPAEQVETFQRWIDDGKQP